jgi:hypothetical protein
MTKPVTPQEMFDLWQKMVNPSAYPLQSLMFPVLDPKEIQKKIGELEVVEHWLKANMNMVQLTVRSLQFQLAMLKGGEKAAEVLMHPEEEAAPPDGTEEAPNPAMWAWNMMASAGKNAADAQAKANAKARAKSKRTPQTSEERPKPRKTRTPP